MGCTQGKDINQKAADKTKDNDSFNKQNGSDTGRTASGASTNASLDNNKNDKTVGRKKSTGLFKDKYDLKETLGKGNYSVVKKGLSKADKTVVAVKCINKSKLLQEDIDALTTEIELLREMDHPHIIKMIDYFEEGKMYYIVTEYVSGGELFDRIVAKECYSEHDAQKVVVTIGQALKYCHDRGVVHRDLKPENILLTSETNDDSIKLADFGFAKRAEVDKNGLTTSCGTPGYVAPEILCNIAYGKEVDMWSLGVIIYILLGGYPPFHDDDQKALFRQIRKGQYSFDPAYWSEVSESAKDLITKLLVVDPKKRLTVEQLLAHKWLQGEASDENMTPALAALRKFQARKKWKQGINGALAVAKLNLALKPKSSDDSLGSGSKDGEKPKAPEGETGTEDVIVTLK